MTHNHLLFSEKKLAPNQNTCLLQRSKMNYRAWYHRCWLVSYMTIEQVNHSLHFLRYPDLLNIWFELVNISYGQISLTLQHFSDFIKLVTFVS
jgi:hypothetical protein